MNEYIQELNEMLENYPVDFEKAEIRKFIENIIRKIDIRNDVPKELKEKIIELKIYDPSEKYYIKKYLVEDNRGINRVRAEDKYELEIINKLLLDDNEILKRFKMAYEKLSDFRVEIDILEYYNALLGLMASTVEDEKIIIELLDKYDDYFNSADMELILMGIKSDDIKSVKIEEYSLKFDNENFNISWVIASIEDDDKKIELMEKHEEKIQNERLLENIIISIQNDNKKIMLLEKYKETFEEKGKIAAIISSIEDDNKKIEKLNEYKSELDNECIAEIIASVKSLKTKVILLEKYQEKLIDNEKLINNIVDSVKGDDKKFELIDEVSKNINESNKNIFNKSIYCIIKNLEDEDKKIEKIKEYKDKLEINYIAELILGIEDVEKKMKLINKMMNFKDLKFVVEVIKTMTNKIWVKYQGIIIIILALIILWILSKMMPYIRFFLQ